jgi:hypothetical protein
MSAIEPTGGDAAEALRGLLKDRSESGAVVAARSAPSPRRLETWHVIVGAAASVALAMLLWALPPEAPVAAGVQGTVRDLNGVAVCGAVASIQGTEEQAQTDENGRFHFTNATPGRRWVVVKVADSGGAALPVDLEEGKMRDLGVLIVYRP